MPLRLCVRPEADATNQERPVDGAARVGMGLRQARVVREHQALELGPLPNKAHLLGRLLLLVAEAVVEVILAC